MTEHSTTFLAVLIAGLAIGGFGALVYAPTVMRMRDEGRCGFMMGGMDSMMRDMSSHCQGYGPGPGNYSATNAVVIGSYSFNPQTLKVQVGTTVTWTNLDTVAHSVESGTPEAPAGLFRSELLSPTESFNYTFNLPGTFIYYCGPHPYMTGTIVVE